MAEVFIGDLFKFACHTLQNDHDLEATSEICKQRFNALKLNTHPKLRQDWYDTTQSVCTRM